MFRPISGAWRLAVAVLARGRGRAGKFRHRQRRPGSEGASTGSDRSHSLHTIARLRQPGVRTRQAEDADGP